MVFSLRNFGGRGGTAGEAERGAPITQRTEGDDDNWNLLGPEEGGRRASGGRNDDIVEEDAVGGEEGWEGNVGADVEDGAGLSLGGSGLSSRSASVAGSGNGGGGGGVGGGGNGGGSYQGGQQGQAGSGTPCGFAAVLQVEGWDYRAEGTVAAELKWQRVVNGEPARNDAFMERVLGLQEFKAFAFMKSGSPWVQVGHGLGKFFSLYGTVPELDGKVLMFVGDRGATRDPVAVQPPVQNTWKWVSANVVNDTEAIVTFARGDHGGNGLWQSGGGNAVLVELKVPYILALPGVLMEYIHLQGGQCRPHELLVEVTRLMGTYNLPADDWSLVIKWCQVAAQAKQDGDSHVALKILPAFSADKSFLDWCDRRIDATMGLRVREVGGNGGGDREYTEGMHKTLLPRRQMWSKQWAHKW